MDAYHLSVVITCEECGHRQRLERRVARPERLWIVCHGCETPIYADVTWDLILERGAALARRA